MNGIGSRPNLGRNDLTDDDVVLLANSKLSDLRWINLDENPLTMRAAETMAAATRARFSNLHTLHLPLNIYDDVEGGVGMYPIQMTVWRPPDGEKLQQKYGDLPWLTPRPPGVRGFLYA